MGKMSTGNEAKKKMTFIGSLPPPLGGATVKNTILIDALGDKGFELNTINLLTPRSSLLKRLFNLFFIENENVIMSLSSKARFFLIPFAFLLVKIKGWNVILLPVGGKLADELLSLPYPLRIFYIRFLRSYDQIFVQSIKLKNELNNILDKDIVSYLPNFKKRPDSIEKEYDGRIFKMVYLGMMTRSKGIFDLINAAEKLKKQYSDIEVHYYGAFSDKDEQRSFKNLIKKKDYITYHGKIEPSQINDELVEYDIFVFPSYHRGEGFPGVFLDAFFSGLPVVASDWRFNGEIIEKGKNGFLCEPKNPEELAKKIKILYENKELLKEMSKNAFQMSERFDLEKVMNGLLDDLRKLGWTSQ